MKYLKLTSIVLPLAIFAAGCAENKPANTAVNTGRPVNSSTPLPAATIDELASGKKGYEQNCAICHKANGTGGEILIEGKKIKPDDLTENKITKFKDEKIIGFMINGITDEGMPSFKNKLSEGEMRDIVKYIRTEIQHH